MRCTQQPYNVHASAAELYIGKDLPLACHDHNYARSLMSLNGSADCHEHALFHAKTVY
jgi:hypothetical protein